MMVGRGEEGGREGVTTVYRLSQPLVSDAGLSRVPCGVCPVSVGREGGREGRETKERDGGRRGEGEERRGNYKREGWRENRRMRS